MDTSSLNITHFEIKNEPNVDLYDLPTYARRKFTANQTDREKVVKA
jgi:hypothetical protein